ncbi:MAG: bifunctional adenosylcobinamide kinase/adenosylcobinamide-phosphate guanylyltransferase [Spirochaetes bacterium]|nr:bifunctional adenosylcobinamide kinase/adenosylcobinamide-phosphate guanylyltransferase [Spirochaetota bacterium]
MGRLIFITGGARSGKSRFAERTAETLAEAKSSRIGYVATAVAMDEEFTERIRIHRERRSGVYETFEEPVAIDRAAEAALATHPVVLLECLTVWLGNVFVRPGPLDSHEGFAMECLERLLEKTAASASTLLLISNEVGLGIVPADPLSRAYRDAHGRINQRVAAAAQEAHFVVSGIPLRLK